MRALWLIIIVLALAGCRTQEMRLPSGLSAERAEILTETQPGGEIWLILRVVAPRLAERPRSAVETAADTAALCETWGIEAAEAATDTPDQIVVQMMSELVERGQPAPDVTQVFAGYRFQNGRCIWEDF